MSVYFSQVLFSEYFYKFSTVILFGAETWNVIIKYS